MRTIGIMNPIEKYEEIGKDKREDFIHLKSQIKIYKVSYIGQLHDYLLTLLISPIKKIIMRV